MGKNEKSKKPMGIIPERFSCPFAGIIPYSKVMSEAEKEALLSLLRSRNTQKDHRFAEYYDDNHNIMIPEAVNDFKPFPCCNIERGEILKCRFYQPLDEIYEEERGSECMLMLQSKTDILANLSTIEKNEIQIEMMEMRMDIFEAQRKKLGLPKWGESDEDEDDDDDIEEDDDDDGGDGGEEVKEEEEQEVEKS